MSRDEITETLRRLPDLPDSAVISVAAAAAHDNVSDRTVRRYYPLIDLAPNRQGVSVGYLRNRQPRSPAAA
jgi:hypothetical protein